MSQESPRRSGERLDPGGCRRVLVVDAVEASRQGTADFFRAHGYEVAVARDAVEALTHSLTRGVDVVIMSTALPGLEGYEAAAILRRISPRVQIILTTEPGGHAGPGESQRTERFRCFAKPLDLLELERAIEEARP